MTAGQTVCSKDEYMVRYCITRNSTSGETQTNDEGYSSSLVIGSSTSSDGTPGEYAIEFKFGTSFSPFINDAVSGTSALGAAGGAVDSVEDIFAHIIITMIALAIIWVGVQTAVSYDKVTEKAFAPFAALGDSTVKMIQSVPSMIPLPHPALAAFTPQGVKAISQGINTGLASAEANKAKDLLSVLQNPGDFGAANEIRNGSANTVDALDKLGNRLLDNNNRPAVVDRLKTIAGGIGDEAVREKLLKKLDKAKDAAAIKTVAAEIRAAVGEGKLGEGDKAVLTRIASVSENSS